MSRSSPSGTGALRVGPDGQHVHSIVVTGQPTKSAAADQMIHSSSSTLRMLGQLRSVDGAWWQGEPRAWRRTDHGWVAMVQWNRGPGKKSYLGNLPEERVRQVGAGVPAGSLQAWRFG